MGNGTKLAELEADSQQNRFVDNQALRMQPQAKSANEKIGFFLAGALHNQKFGKPPDAWPPSPAAIGRGPRPLNPAWEPRASSARSCGARSGAPAVASVPNRARPFGRGETYQFRLIAIQTAAFVGIRRLAGAT